MNCLSRRAEVDVPAIPALPAPMVPALPTPALPMPPVAEHVAVLVVAGEIVGIVGSNELGPTVPTMGNTPVVGTAGAELTPRLLISIEPNGIPVRAPPPGVVGVVDVDVGVDDEAMLLEPEPQPEPHVPDIPDVSSVPEDPEDIGISDVTDVPDDVDVPDIAVLPVVAAVAGAAVPAAVPPPSKLVVDPNIPDGEDPVVEQLVPPLVIAPLVGIAIVPVTPPVGAGLTPSELISVAPSGIPLAPTDPLGPSPSGEVTPSEGVAVIGSSTWANAGPAHNRDQAVATINNDLMVGSPIEKRIKQRDDRGEP